MLYLFAAALVWAFSYGFIKTYLTSLDPNFVSFCRMASALPFFIPFLKLTALPYRAVLSLLGIGAIQYGLMYVFFIHSFQYLNAHQAVLFTTFTPLYVILVDRCFPGEKRGADWLAALLAVIGGMVIYFQYMELENIWKGFLCVQIADLCFAFGQIAYKRFRKKMPLVVDKEVYAWLFVGAVTVTAIVTTWFGGWSSLEKVTGAQAAVLVYLGAVASGLCFFWWNKGALLVLPGTLAVLNNLKTPLALAVSVFVFQEHTDLLRLVLGMSLLVAALFFAGKQKA